jgi:hypothetical protein
MSQIGDAWWGWGDVMLRKTGSCAVFFPWTLQLLQAPDPYFAWSMSIQYYLPCTLFSNLKDYMIVKQTSHFLYAQ